MGASFGGDDDVIADINITPFVDIILVILIIFMVTATTDAIKDVIPATLPDAATGEKTDTISLGVALTDKGALLLDGEEVTRAQLEARLVEAKAETDDVVVLVSADKQVSYGRLVWVVDLIRSKGVGKWAMNVDPKQAVAPDPASVGEGTAPGL